MRKISVYLLGLLLVAVTACQATAPDIPRKNDDETDPGDDNETSMQIESVRVPPAGWFA